MGLTDIARRATFEPPRTSNRLPHPVSPLQGAFPQGFRPVLEGGTSTLAGIFTNDRWLSNGGGAPNHAGTFSSIGGSRRATKPRGRILAQSVAHGWPPTRTDTCSHDRSLTIGGVQGPFSRCPSLSAGRQTTPAGPSVERSYARARSRPTRYVHPPANSHRPPFASFSVFSKMMMCCQGSTSIVSACLSGN
jgi:hypothetical protein